MKSFVYQTPSVPEFVAVGEAAAARPHRPPTRGLRLLDQGARPRVDMAELAAQGDQSRRVRTRRALVGGDDGGAVLRPASALANANSHDRATLALAVLWARLARRVPSVRMQPMKARCGGGRGGALADTVVSNRLESTKQ